MRLFTGALLQGIASGCVIALLAAGVTIVYRSTRVLNFAQGSFATLAAYLYYQLVVLWGWPAGAAFPLVIVASAAMGLVAEQLAIRPLEHAEPTVRAAGTIGLVLIVQWLVITVWTAQQRFLPALSDAGVTIGGERLGAQHLAIVIATVVVGGALGLALVRTRAGLALSATAQDAQAARLLGVGPRAVSMATFALAGVIGAVAGILATPLLVLTPSQMTLVLIVALGASLAGGFESLPRTIAAGIALGVIQSLVTAYAPATSGLPQAAGFLAVLLLLAIVRRRVNLVDILRGSA
jgi:branched-subunit amino acid ABC-type transport system permease component